eukprot:1159404-Pyramimonas_sp.AAC.2
MTEARWIVGRTLDRRAMELLREAEAGGIVMDYDMATCGISVAARCGDPAAAKRYHSMVVDLGRRPNLLMYRGT